MMEHFLEQAWADRVRGFKSPRESQGIDAHLAGGCLDCKTAAAWWDRVLTTARAEQSYAPPENVVRLVKLEFESQKGEEATGWHVAGLLFDTLSQPVLAGVRSAGVAARQLVYEAGELTVDLRFERASAPGMVNLAGQILHKTQAAGAIKGALIVIWAENRRPIATTVANEFGEFQLDFEPRPGLSLTARVGPHRVRIQLENTLDHLRTEPATGYQKGLPL